MRECGSSNRCTVKENTLKKTHALVSQSTEVYFFTHSTCVDGGIFIREIDGAQLLMIRNRCPRLFSCSSFFFKHLGNDCTWQIRNCILACWAVSLLNYGLWQIPIYVLHAKLCHFSITVFGKFLLISFVSLAH